jgi:hypothetical protein
MIISINATVCAAADHGEEGQHKIAGNDQRRRCGKGVGEESDHEKQEVYGARQKRWFFE